MKPKIISTDINVQKCVRESGGSQFDLIIHAAERARQISKRQSFTAKDNPGMKFSKPITLALWEIQTGESPF
jgi:DNA-directed RNA polymerase omega subunit